MARIVAFIALVLLNLMVTPALAACTTPAGNEGDINYVSSLHVMVYCNGTSWIGMGVTQPVSFGTLTTNDFCTATSGTAIACTTAAINLASQVTGTLPSVNGGTGLATYSTGDILYGTAANALAALPIGTSGYVLTVGVSGVPTWSPSVTNSVANFSAGTTGFTPVTATTGTVTLAGTLGVANGGTGTATALTKGSVVIAGTGGVYTQDNANFFYDATNHRLGIGTATPTQGLTVFGNIDAGGTNGYLTEIANAGTTGTTVNKLAKLNTSGAAVIAATADIDGMLGIVVGGAGTAGNAQIATSGQASCVFDGQTVPGDYVSISASVAGDCLDGGTSRPLTNQTIGRVLTANSGVGTTATIAIGLSGSGQGGVPTGTIMAFAGTCPAGWTEYTAARGRFLRGIDNGAGNDPDGTRAAGAVQADAFQGHGHNYYYDTSGTGSFVLNGGSGRFADGTGNGPVSGHVTTPNSDGTNGTPRIASETRPKNVAVTFCQYQGGSPITTTASGTTNYVARFISTTALGTGTLYDSGSAVGLSTASPQNLLDVNGAASIGYNVAAPVNGLIVSGNVGIGTTAPQTIVHAASQVAGDTIRITDYMGASATGGGFGVQSARGTSAAPTALQSGDRVGGLFLTGYDGATFTQGSAIFGEVDGSVTGGSSFPTRLTFYTTPSGSESRQEAMRITNGGNLGIGATNPTTKLTVLGPGPAGNALFANTDYVSGSAGSGILISTGAASGNTYSTVNAFQNGFGASGWATLILQSGGGNVGIGTTVPATSLQIVGGDMRLDRNLATDGAVQFAGANDYVYGNASSHYLEFGTNAVPRMHITGNGNVGIGTTSPVSLLQVYPYAVANGVAPSLSADNGIATFTTNTTPELQIGGYPASPYAMWMQVKRNSNDGTSWPLAIQPLGGNVGIGTAAPNASLDVYTNSSTYAAVFRGVGATGGAVGLGAVGSSTGLIQGATSDALAATANLAINPSGGNVGIGTTVPNYLLDVRGAMMIKPISGAANLLLQDGAPTTTGSLLHSSTLFQISDNANPLELDANTNGGNSGQLYLATNGRVGVGTTVANATLMVNGTATFGTASSVGAINVAGVSIDPAGRIYVTRSNNDNVMEFNWQPTATRVGSILVSSTATTFTTSSDRRLKENFVATTRGLNDLMAIPVQDFNFILDKDKKRVQGFVAQDLYKIYPEAVNTNGDDGKVPLKDGRGWSVDYGRLTPLVISAVQQLKALLDIDHNELAALKADNDVLREANESEAAQIRALTERLDILENSRHSGRTNHPN